MTEATHVLMHHAESGGTALFPAGAADLWVPRGWALVEEPTPDVPPKADPTPDTRPAARKRATDSQE